MSDIQIEKVKLVIWDLDDTFWKGTLSEGPIEAIADNIRLVKELTERGIVNSICSKNDETEVSTQLQKQGIDDFFVFKSIDWTPKGQRIAGLIKEIGLRPANCLFIDDNIVNLNEAKYYSPDLMVAAPNIVQRLMEFCEVSTASDLEHKRLKQYKTLEIKQKAKKDSGDNLQFLYASNTRVSIHKDCLSNIDRIFELIHRTNQLNFTKNRCSREELITLLVDDNVDCGYVTVQDNWGGVEDYGIIGFYAMKNHCLIHFLFSCRTIGQGVEQWVYSTLGCPHLDVVGDVVNPVVKIAAPAWINQQNMAVSEVKTTKKVNGKVLFKGPCDLMVLTSFLDLSSDSIITEFTYTSNGKSIEHHNHSLNYLQFPRLNDKDRERLLSECVFNDKGMFDTALYDDDIRLVFLSTFTDPNLAIYQRNRDGYKIAFGEWWHDLTNPIQWGLICEHPEYFCNNHFTKEWLQKFSESYSYVGVISVEDYYANILKVLERLNPDAKLCLILGSERKYSGETEKAYDKILEFHIEINKRLRQLSQENDRVLLVDFNNYITSEEDFTNNINHFQRRIYFNAAKDVQRIIESETSLFIKRSRYKLYRQNAYSAIYSWVKRHRTVNAFVHTVRKFFRHN